MNGQPWTKDEEAALRTVWASGLRGEALARLLGERTGIRRSPAAIAAKATSLGLGSPLRPEAWSEGELRQALAFRDYGLRWEELPDAMAARGWPRRTAHAYASAWHKAGGEPERVQEAGQNAKRLARVEVLAEEILAGQKAIRDSLFRLARRLDALEAGAPDLGLRPSGEADSSGS